MKYLFSINISDSSWNRFVLEYPVWDVFLFSATLSHVATNWKSLNHKISHAKKMDPWDNHNKKFWTHEIPTGKISLSKKYSPENVLKSQNVRDKKFRTHEIPKKTWWHDSTRPTRPTMAHDPSNLAHSVRTNFSWK